MTTKRTTPRSRRILRQVLCTLLVLATAGPGSMALGSHEAPRSPRRASFVAQRTGSPWWRDARCDYGTGFAAGRSAGWHAGYRDALHGRARFGGRVGHPRGCGRDFALGYLDGFPCGYDRGFSLGRDALARSRSRRGR